MERGFLDFHTGIHVNKGQVLFKKHGWACPSYININQFNLNTAKPFSLSD